MRVAVAIAALLLCAASAEGQASTGSEAVFAWADKNAKLFAGMLGGLGITPKTMPAQTVGTVLVPSDKAVEAFLKGMKLSYQELLGRKQLLDLIVAYHFIPGYTAKDAGNVPTNPTVAATADANYILRFYKGGGGNVWVQDVQGNNATIPAQKPLLFGKDGSLAVVPVDRVLMSGGYFFTGLDALKHYPGWADAFALAKEAGWPTGDASADLTMFVPSAAAVGGAKPAWAALSAEDKKKQLLYHFARPAMSIPAQLKSGKLPTLLEGHDLVVQVNDKTKDGVPEVTITPEQGPSVKVDIFNIFAGRGVLQGVDGSIAAKLGGGSKAAATASESGKKPRRALLRVGRGGDNGMQQATANSIAASNTQRAINAAAEGNISARAATTYGSYQAQQAAAYGNDYCYNCRRW